MDSIGIAYCPLLFPCGITAAYWPSVDPMFNLMGVKAGTTVTTFEDVDKTDNMTFYPDGGLIWSDVFSHSVLTRLQ